MEWRIKKGKPRLGHIKHGRHGMPDQPRDSLQTKHAGKLEDTTTNQSSTDNIKVIITII